MPVRCILWSRSDHAREVHFMVKKRLAHRLVHDRYIHSRLEEVISGCILGWKTASSSRIGRLVRCYARVILGQFLTVEQHLELFGV